ncbi:hypothetical protein BAE44_0019362 [Dichanthelium oligosanthes]|uniref:Protein kinase domain-containing protein n=1 Tax=Dichanthelium oligosanthes TaxID=888268 RepID=A0A1E5V392_9POAL|nr:hypothetical protein BAE44_0019362 [Dichanthelium oligosanthes]
MITFRPAASFQFLRFESDGHLRLYEWKDDHRDWSLEEDAFKMDACDYPNVCGDYGVFSIGQCSCPSDTGATYFNQIVIQRPDLGCTLLNPISCQSLHHHQLIGIANVSSFIYYSPVSVRRRHHRKEDENDFSDLAGMPTRCESQVMTRMRGTPGYMAPECLTSQITEKVDVYSFGIVVMEIISGRKNLDYSQHESSVQLIILLQEKAQNDLLEDMIERSSDDMHLHKEDVIETRRPAMSVVMKVMEGERSVESNLDYNFFNPSPAITVQVGDSKFSDPPVVSVLSAPR